MTRNSLRDRVAPLGIFALTTCFLTFPVVLHLGSFVIGRPFEDAFEQIWYLYWYKHAIFDLHVSPWFQPEIFYPAGFDLRFVPFPPFYPFLLAPLTLLIGPVAAYNLTVIASSVLAAYGIFLVVRLLGGSIWGGLLAGMAFAFYPQREVYFSGHLNFLLGSMWLPWMLYGVVYAARFPARRTRGVVLAFCSFALAIAGALHFVYLGGVAFLIAALGYWLPGIKSQPKAWGKSLIVGILVWGVIAVPLLAGAMDDRRQVGAGSQFSFDSTDASSVSTERLLVPSGINPIIWDFARKTFPLQNGADGVVSLGYVPMALALFLLLRERSGVHLKVGLMLVAIGGILMLGTTLHFWGRAVWVPIPEPLGRLVDSITHEAGVALVKEGRMRVPLPSAFLYLALPPLRSFHNFGRWGLISALGVAILGGLGLTKLTSSWSRRKRLVLAGLACLMLLMEFNMQPLPSTMSTVQMHRDVDDWLAANAGSSTIIEYPLSYTMKGQSLYYTIAHGQKIVHGYRPILPPGFSEMLPVLNQWPEPAALDLLAQIGAKYVLVHSFIGDNFEHQQLPALLASPRLKLIDVFPTSIGNVRQIYLFELCH